MDARLVDTAVTSKKRKRDENKEELKKKIILIAAGVVCMFMGVVAWYYNEYFVEEAADNWELDPEDEIVASIKQVTKSLEKLTKIINKKLDEKDIQEVLDEVALIPDLNEQQWAKAVYWLTDNLSQLAIVRALPIQKKKTYIFAFIS